MAMRVFGFGLVIHGMALLSAAPAFAQPPALTPAAPATATVASPGAEAKPAERSISDWLMRMHDASRKRAYIGTFVVSTGSALSSARIWHICDGEQQMERVESLTGAPKSTFRRNDNVITFSPDSKLAFAEKRESLGLFPDLLRAADSSLAQFYSARSIGVARVAGFETDVVQLAPKDNLRFGYRVWSERKSGLVVRLQTLAGECRVLAQATLLQEISTPVIPLTDQILVLPLVGAIDTQRAQQVLSTVLERLRTSGAQIVLLDITGVPIIDTQVAHTLIRTGQAVQLLGAQMVLTGIRPEIAQALVGLGVELTSMVTYGTLQSGLADILKRRGARLEARMR